jgi:hypothetical protein
MPLVVDDAQNSLVLCRYYTDDKGVARKMEVLVDMQHSLNIEHLRARGPQADERMQPSNPSAATNRGPLLPRAAAATAAPQVNELIVSELSAVMPGYSSHAYRRAAAAVGNSDANAALNWLLNHSEDANINDPLPDMGRGSARPGGGEGTGAAASVDEANVAHLQDMGFSDAQARAALLAEGGATDRAVAWLVDQGANLDAAVEKVLADAKPVPLAPSSDRSPVRPAHLSRRLSANGGAAGSCCNAIVIVCVCGSCHTCN